MTFIEKSLRSLTSAADYSASAESLAARAGILQTIDPRVKVAGLFGLILIVAAARELRVIAALLAFTILLAVASRIPLARLAAWVWLPSLLFTGAIALPAVFLSPQGGRGAAFLVSRAITAVTLSTLLVLTTPWPRILRALRAFHCPVVIVAILGMTYRYIFVILRTAFEMLESRKSRTVGRFHPRDSRRIATASVGVLLSKSIQMSGDIHLAMQSRGFRGEIYLLDDSPARAADWCWLAFFAAVAAAAVWGQR